jgi:hypothetical protein
MMKWLYRKSDNVFLTGGDFFILEPPRLAGPDSEPDWANYGVVEMTVEESPDLVKDRFDHILKKRPATPEELTAAADVELQEKAALTSREKDILTTCALIVRYSNVVAWNAMTVAQKKAATLAAADIWRDLRVFAEKNL